MRRLKMKCFAALLVLLAVKQLAYGDGGSTSGSASGEPDLMPELPTASPDEEIISRITKFLSAVPLPVLIGVGAGGGAALIGIIFLFTVSSIALLRQRYYKNRVRKVKIKQIKPSYTGGIAW